jgi:hypothetical protein
VTSRLCRYRDRLSSCCCITQTCIRRPGINIEHGVSLCRTGTVLCPCEAAALRACGNCGDAHCAQLPLQARSFGEAQPRLCSTLNTAAYACQCVQMRANACRLRTVQTVQWRRAGILTATLLSKTSFCQVQSYGGSALPSSLPSLYTTRSAVCAGLASETYAQLPEFAACPCRLACIYAPHLTPSLFGASRSSCISCKSPGLKTILPPVLQP